MKKILLSLIAVLLLTGTVYAAGIPMATDPQNSPEVWTVEVYNNSGSALTSGTVVVWDMGSDTTDASYAYRTMWITTTTTADDINVAGVVVDPSIPASTEGTIAIWGPVYTLTADSTDAVTANQVVGTTTVAGQCGEYTTANNSGILGWCIYAAPVSLAYGGDGGTNGLDKSWIPIFLQPHAAD